MEFRHFYLQHLWVERGGQLIYIVSPYRYNFGATRIQSRVLSWLCRCGISTWTLVQIIISKLYERKSVISRVLKRTISFSFEYPQHVLVVK